MKAIQYNLMLLSALFWAGFVLVLHFLPIIPEFLRPPLWVAPVVGLVAFCGMFYAFCMATIAVGN